ncbi:MAG: exopolysaccharide Pel transporter PelG [Spirochaetales bacterium]|nr:exopolysaccharide Pel transporter PelG [Spirochaetales bacterium]
MAGIGFELKKIVRRRELSSTMGAMLGGLFVVAGPWLLTIITLVILRRWETGVSSSETLFFQSALVYSYGASLVLFAPLHYFFSRLASDLIWEKRTPEAFWYLNVFIVLVGLGSFLFSWILVGLIPLPVQDPQLFRLSWALFFAFLNGVWLLMLFVSTLKWFTKILVVFALGMAVGTAGAGLSPVSWGSAGWLLSLAVGQLGVAAGLWGLCRQAFHSQRPTNRRTTLRKVAKSNSPLIWGGVAYVLAPWFDKAWFWWTRGSGGLLPQFPPYDTTAYWANLAVIPAWVYFVIFAETDFAEVTHQFLFALSRQTLDQIQNLQVRLALTFKKQWGNSALVILVSLLLEHLVLEKSVSDPGIYLAALAGAGFQALLGIGVSFAYYIEQYSTALKASAVFLLSTVVLDLFLPPGAGYALAGFLGCLTLAVLLSRKARSLTRQIFLKYS